MNNQNTQGGIGRGHVLILYPAPSRMLVGLTLGLLLVAAGIWEIVSGLSGGLPWSIGIGIVTIVLFGLLSLPFLGALARPFPVFVVNEEGIQQRGPFPNVFVAWNEIATIRSSIGVFLYVDLSEAGRKTFSARSPWRWRLTRLSFIRPIAIFLNPFWSPLPAQQLIEILQERYQKQIEDYHIALR